MFLVFSPGSLRERSLQNRKFPISEQHIKSRNKKYRKDNNNNNNNETTGKTKRNYACAILLPIGWKLPAQMVRKRGRKATIFQNHFQFLKVHFSMIICFTELRVPETAYFALLFTMFNNSFFSDWLEKDELMSMRKEAADWNLPIILLRGDASQFHSFFLSIPVEQENKNKLKCSINSPSWCRQPPFCCR